MYNRSNIPAIISYITWVGFIIAIVIGDRTDGFTRHHMNQALVISILGFIGGVLNIIPVLGNIASGIISLAVLVFSVLGIYRAATWSTEPLPFIGDFHLIG